MKPAKLSKVSRDNMCFRAHVGAWFLLSICAIGCVTLWVFCTDGYGETMKKATCIWISLFLYCGWPEEKQCYLVI